MNSTCHLCGRSHDTKTMGYRAFVCSCGANLETKRSARVTTTMPCPQCQALVNPGVAKCVHCNGALLTKSCHDCDQLVYVGHATCPHCHATFGSSASVPAIAARARSCPRCQSLLTSTQVAGGALDNCGACGGSYVEHSVLETLLHDVQRNSFEHAEALACAAPQRMAPPTTPPTGYVKCPDCRTIMNRRQFAHGAGVVIDGCKGHGTFFDAGELRKVVDFMKSGGLVKAAHVEQQRQAAMQREAARARTTLLASSPARMATGGDEATVTGADLVAELILALF
ncbi:MAG: zf-TFIIB domain-containing protein [Kofleriaceae bacterium]|nr:zf-TFIIB domain-containing protein [Kofleriaceae bacterium]